MSDTEAATAREPAHLIAAERLVMVGTEGED